MGGLSGLQEGKRADERKKAKLGSKSNTPPRTTGRNGNGGHGEMSREVEAVEILATENTKRYEWVGAALVYN